MEENKEKQESNKVLKIKLNLGGKPYPLNIKPEREELYRRAEREINRQVALIKSKFRSDAEGYMAMAALQIMMNSLELANSRSLGAELDELVEMERKLDDHLNKLMTHE
ncbi:MAG: cell division protein ZapA [Tidjanibacter sp.]|nr:cell division protein ZapA [Tidjanibacter sp.]MBR6831698.1 cell division protein ZapA [Tidjanibacter sp.]